MAYPRRSGFVYPTGDFELRWPARAWRPKFSTLGSRHISAAGIAAGYRVRADYLIVLTLRILESEWDAFIAFVAAVQSPGDVFTWYPDVTELVSFEVWLEEPAPGESIEPTRSEEYMQMFEATITLRGADGGQPWPQYFAPFLES